MHPRSTTTWVERHGGTNAKLAHNNTEFPLTPADVLTVSDVAELLRMPRSTVYDLARRGLLPGHRLGRSLRFIRAEIDAWLRAS